MISCLTHFRAIRSNAFFASSLSPCYFSTRPRPDPSTFLFKPDKVEIVDELSQKLQTDEIKYRRHPGRFGLPAQRIDSNVLKSIGRLLTTSGQVGMYKAMGEKMEQYMKNRRLPPEPHDLLHLRQSIEKRVREREAEKGRAPEYCETEDERGRYEEKITRKCEHRLRTSIYKWKAMEYDNATKCMAYCVARFAPEYAVLRRVFHEIARRETNFKPRQVFDFGSGIGTTFFASESTWPGSSTVEEYFCVDASQDMTDLFNLLLRNGDVASEPCHRNVTFRPFLPATTERQYDLVVSAYSLFELPSYEERMRTLANLWMKTGKFLVIVERGTNAGFRAVIEARDYILAGCHEIHRQSFAEMGPDFARVDADQVALLLKRKDLTESEKFRLLREKYPDVEFPTLLPHGHVFAPCPHDMGCPRLADVTPCNFAVSYFPVRLSGGEELPETELFSFVILRKGFAPDPTNRWPRIVREPRKSKSCVWCTTCTPHGVLEDKSFVKAPKTEERGKLFRLVTESSWGDSLPVITSYDDEK